MTDQTLLSEAADPATPVRRLLELGEHSDAEVRRAALTNRSVTPRQLATFMGRSDVAVSESAIDAVLARGDQFHEVIWDDRRAAELVRVRCSEWESDGAGERVYAVSDDDLDAFIRAAVPHGTPEYSGPGGRAAKLDHALAFVKG